MIQLGDILWRLDGHHEKLAAKQCAVPSTFLQFQGYNIPKSYKQKQHENVTSMSQTLFDILQQVGCVLYACVYMCVCMCVRLHV